MKYTRGRTAAFLVVLAFLGLGLSNPHRSNEIGPSTDENIRGSILPYSVWASEENGEKANITFWVRDSENKTDLGGLNLTIFDLGEGTWSTYTVNQTGHINLFQLGTRSYVVWVREENRTLGFEEIDVPENGT